MKKYLPFALGIIALVVPILTSAADIPAGEPVTLQGIEDTVRELSRFLIRLSGIGAAIALLIIGLWMVFAKEEATFAKAKAWFWRALLGALVIFGVGVILNTIQGVFTGDFFGGF